MSKLTEFDYNLAFGGAVRGDPDFDLEKVLEAIRAVDTGEAEDARHFLVGKLADGLGVSREQVAQDYGSAINEAVREWQAENSRKASSYPFDTRRRFTVQGTVTGRGLGMHPTLAAPFSPGKSVNPAAFFQDFSDLERRASSLPPTMAVPYGKIYELCGGSRQPGLKAKELWVVTNIIKGRKPRGCRHLTPAGVWQGFSWQRDTETGLMEWRRND